jgi:hypothetical protein
VLLKGSANKNIHIKHPFILLLDLNICLEIFRMLHDLFFYLHLDVLLLPIDVNYEN